MAGHEAEENLSIYGAAFSGRGKRGKIFLDDGREQEEEAR
jgi:hypothetical protein